MKLDQVKSLLQDYYPQVQTTSHITLQALRYFQNEHKLTPDRILLANSICSDDINGIEFPEEARSMLGPFNLGGLDGFPFVGLTGMSAFAQHVPEGGASFVFYGPHIGFAPDGKLGQVLRVGQSKASSCCGAAAAALARLSDNQPPTLPPSNLDYQQDILYGILYRERDRVLAAENPIYEATEVIYEATDKRILDLIARTSFVCKTVFLMGAILINAGLESGSLAEVRHFRKIKLADGAIEDLMPHLHSL